MKSLSRPSFSPSSPRRLLLAFVAGAMALVLPPLAAAAQGVTAAVSPNLVTVGERATYTITFHNSDAAVPPLSLPAIDGVQFHGPSTANSFSSINGRTTRSASLSYTVVPLRPGTYAIAPAPFAFDGRTITLPPSTLEVRPAASADPDDPNAAPPLLLHANLAPPSPFLHQTAVLTLEILSLPSLNLADSFSLADGTLPASGCIASDFTALDPDRVTAPDGTLYNRRRFRSALRFTTAGTFTLTPGIRANILTRPDPSSHRRRASFGMPDFDDMFDGFPFGGPSLQATPVDIATPEPLAITVRAIPTANRPSDYTGAVGSYTFTASASPTDPAVGEPVTVTCTLAGDGNIVDARPPSYSDTTAYRAYEPKMSGDAPAPNSPGGIKRYDQVVIPRTDSLLELPPLSFTYFDPAAGEYRTAIAGPFPLHVKPAPAGAASSALLLAPDAHPAAPGAATSALPGAPPAATLVMATDIHYLHPVPHAPPLPQRLDAALRTHPLPALATYASPLLLLGLLALVRARHDRLASDSAARRRHRAPRTARAEIRAAEAALHGNAPPTEVAAHLSAAATTYFAHRLNLPPGAADPPLILRALAGSSSPVAAADLPQWQATFELLDHIQYAGQPAIPADLETAITTLTLLLRHAERIPL